MRTLVTGGAGFIGSHVVDSLVARGDEVLVIDDLSSGDFGWTDAGLILKADIRSREAAEAVRRFRPSSVVHLAAQMSVKVSMHDPQLDAEINVLGLLNIANAAAEAATESIVFASSGGTIYGDVAEDRQPIGESARRAPLSFYGVTKSVAIDYLHVIGREHGIRHVELALGNVYGPRQDPSGEAGVIAIFAGRALKGETCVVNGDGKTTRDYVHVSDVARAFTEATLRGHGLVNIGTGLGTSVLDIFDGIASASGIDGQRLGFGPPLAGEVRHVALDPSRAFDQLGWSPRVVLQHGLTDLVSWMQAQPAMTDEAAS